MKRQYIGRRWLSVLLVAVAMSGPALAGDQQAQTAAGKPKAQAQAQAQAQTQAQGESQAGKAQDQTQGKAAEERAKIMEEAVTALAKTNSALRALDAGDTEKAMEDLALAVGKLELVTSAHPELALAPVDVQVITHDLIARPEDVKKAVEDARKLLDEGRVQEARAILKDLGSEVIVRVVNIPLATYPDAIKAVAPLIEAGKIEEAKRALVAALGTLVVVDNVIPLPLVRAERAVDEAKALAAKKDRSKEENERLAELLQVAEDQLELAQVLGYAEEKALEPLEETVEQIAKKTASGGTEESLFDKLKKGFEELRAKL